MSNFTMPLNPSWVCRSFCSRDMRIDLPSYGIEGAIAAIDNRLGLNLATVSTCTVYSRPGETRLSFDATHAGLSVQSNRLRTARIDDTIEFTFGRTQPHRAYGSDIRIVVDGQSYDTRLYFTECRIHRRGLVLGEAGLLMGLQTQAGIAI